MSWIQSVMLGFVSGICEPLPMSAEAHRGLLRYIMDVQAEHTLFLLFSRIAVLAVLLWVGKLELRRLRHTARILRTPTCRRTGRPDLNSAGTLKMLRGAAVLAVAGRIVGTQLLPLANRIWIPVIPLLVCGVILWLPRHFRTANKDGRHLTAADGFLMGLGFLLSAVPGLSAVGIATAIGSLRGASRAYALRFSWLLTAISLTAGIAMDALSLAISGFAVEPNQLLHAGLGGISAAIGAYLAIHFARSRIRPGAAGLGGFCYYNWGQALLCAALFLLV